MMSKSNPIYFQSAFKMTKKSVIKNDKLIKH